MKWWCSRCKRLPNRHIIAASVRKSISDHARQFLTPLKLLDNGGDRGEEREERRGELKVVWYGSAGEEVKRRRGEDIIGRRSQCGCAVMAAGWLAALVVVANGVWEAPQGWPDRKRDRVSAICYLDNHACRATTRPRPDLDRDTAHRGTAAPLSPPGCILARDSQYYVYSPR